MKISDKTEFIDWIETWNSGGNVMLDIIKLKSDQVLVISDEVVCKYDSIKAFQNDDGEHDYDNDCVELFDHRQQENITSFVWNDITITDPFLSSCGRFNVKPGSYYGKAYFDSLKPKEE
jgi:hypothetical protein